MRVCMKLVSGLVNTTGFGIFCLSLLAPALAVAASPYRTGEKWFVDLGGKTADIVGLRKPLTGLRAGVSLANNINIGAEAFTLAKSVKNQSNGNYQQQISYNYFGAHVEYSYNVTHRVSLIPGVSAGLGMGTYEEKDGDVVGRSDTGYTSVEPSIMLSVRVIKSMWLNVGGSYFMTGDEAGFKDSTSLNIFARYKW